jgi:hypothetical protein
MSTNLELLRESIKTNISSPSNTYDVAGQWLPPGNYYFLINYVGPGIFKGQLNCRGFAAEYTFAAKDVVKMMACAQARLARRANITDDEMPTYSSPLTSPINNYPSQLLSHRLGNVQPPHTSPTMRTHRRRLPDINTRPTCTICLDFLDDNPKTLPCGHKFHEHCITRWCATRPNCPVCRRGVSLGRRRPAPIANRRVSRYAVIHRQVTNYARGQRSRINTNRQERQRRMPRRGYRNQQSLPNLLV